MRVKVDVAASPACPADSTSTIFNFAFCLRFVFLAVQLLIGAFFTTGKSFTKGTGGGPTSSPLAIAARVIGPGCQPLFCWPMPTILCTNS